MTNNRFFEVTAGIEIGAGLALIVAPAFVISLVFGSSQIPAVVAVGRLAGAALVSLGAACWWARHDGRSAASRGLVSSLLIYNVAVVALVLCGSFGALSSPLWAVVAAHGALAIWCVLLLRSGR